MTSRTELQDLIQTDVDGVASAADRALLGDLLANDPEARDEHRRLLGLRELLAAVPPEAPPVQLAADVMRAVRAERAGFRGSVRRLLASWPGGRIAIPYAYAAAAGAAVGILGYHVLTGGGPLGPDAIEREAAATIGSARVGVEKGRLALTAGSVSGSATLRRLDDGVALDVELPSDRPLDVRVAFDPVSVNFVGISNKTGGVDRIEIADGTVRWSQDRPQRVTIFLAPRMRAASEVDVRVSGEGGSAGGGTLDLPGRD